METGNNQGAFTTDFIKIIEILNDFTITFDASYIGKNEYNQMIEILFYDIKFQPITVKPPFQKLIFGSKLSAIFPDKETITIHFSESNKNWKEVLSYFQIQPSYCKFSFIFNLDVINKDISKIHIANFLVLKPITIVHLKKPLCITKSSPLYIDKIDVDPKHKYVLCGNFSALTTDQSTCCFQVFCCSNEIKTQDKSQLVTLKNKNTTSSALFIEDSIESCLGDIINVFESLDDFEPRFRFDILRIEHRYDKKGLGFWKILLKDPLNDFTLDEIRESQYALFAKIENKNTPNLQIEKSKSISVFPKFTTITQKLKLDQQTRFIDLIVFPKNEQQSDSNSTLIVKEFSFSQVIAEFFCSKSK